MANQRIKMRKLKTIIRLKASGMAHKAIAKRVGLSRTTTIRYIQLLEQSGLTYEQLLALPEAELAARFLPAPVITPAAEATRYQVLSQQFAHMEQQLTYPGVTRRLLWEEYRKQHPDGYLYTQFCFHFQRWQKQRKIVLHLEHKAGDKLMVDFTGQKWTLIDSLTGQEREVEIFAAILAASQYLYVEATASQRKADFIGALENALWYFQGVPQAIVPDNLKSAVKKADRYEPELNETLADFAQHYGITILPTRARKPQDKGLVENAVTQIYRRIFAPLRGQVFHSLAALNEAIRSLLPALNQTCFQGRPYSRTDLFNEIERSALQALPLTRYPWREFRQGRVQQNCHVLLPVDKHYYSVPYRYCGQRVKLVYSSNSVEIYHQYERIAFHVRDERPFRYSTQIEHLPPNHQFVLQWSPERFLEWAASIGPATQAFIAALLAGKTHPEQGYKASWGVLSLAKRVERERLEKACERALHFESYSYQSLKTILDKGLESVVEVEPVAPIPHHANIRGPAYYQ